jgi:threonine synthase
MFKEISDLNVTIKPFQPELVCTNGHPAGPLDWRCSQCAAPIHIMNLPPFDENAIRGEEWSLWRYGAMLPAVPHVTLGEGMTPLIQVKLPDGLIWAKLENLNPTGSFKDRGTAVLVNYLIEQGVGQVVEDSSGNAGAALAAYTGASGIQARIFVPENAPPNKKRLIALSAQLVEIDGPRAASTDACYEAARTAVYASHAWSPFFIAGQMTCAWEIWEQMGWRAPDAVICPVGQGGLFLGIARGFASLKAAGLIDHVPRMYAAQAAACDPIVRAWETDADDVTVVEERETAADGIVVAKSVHSREILQVIRKTGGMAIRLNEKAILTARNLLSKRGLLIEPTSATAIAALPTVRAHLAGGSSEIVVPLTGNGLKTINARG